MEGLVILSPRIVHEKNVYPLSLKKNDGDFPGGPVARNPHSQCRGLGFDPWPGNYKPTCHN